MLKLSDPKNVVKSIDVKNLITYFNLLYLSFSSCNSGDSHSNDSISNTENFKNIISKNNCIHFLNIF